MAFGHKHPVDTANYTLRDMCNVHDTAMEYCTKYINRQMPRKNQTACIALRDFSYNDNIESKNLISTRLACLAHKKKDNSK